MQVTISSYQTNTEIMTHQFRTTLKSREITFINEDQIHEYNNESEESLEVNDMIIVWQVEFELREYGIKSAVASVIDFEFTALQEDYTDSDTNETLKGFETTFKNDDSWKVEILGDNFTFDCMCLGLCDIDFDEGTIEFS